MNIIDWDWSFLDFTLLLLALTALLYYLGTRNYDRFSKYNIPHPKPVPFFGNMMDLLYQKRAFPYKILDLYNRFKNHQYAGFFMFLTPVILINDPELIKTIAIKDFEYFSDRRPIFTDQKGKGAIWAKGLPSLNGNRWKEMRTTLSPTFTSSKMKTMFVLMSECCKQLVNFLEEAQHKSNPGCNISKEGNMMVLELKEFFTRYTNDVIATTAFGVGVDSLKQPKNEFFLMGQEAIKIGPARVFGFLAFPKLMALLRINLIPGNVSDFFSSLVLDTMETREKQGIFRPDLLQLLMEAKKNSLQDQNKTIKIDDEDIVAQAVLFFIAGFDAASTLLCFVCYLVATHPEVHKKLQDEVDKTLKENDGKITYEALNSMKYLDMVVSETLRIYPPAPSIDRICIKRYTLQADPPLELYPGDSIFFPIFGLQRDPKYYSDPDKFDPERFSDENKHKINPNAYIPFGVGPRVCIGNRFALLETKLAVAYLLTKFNIKTMSKTPKSIVIILKGLNISIQGGFWMGLESRNS